MSWVAALLTLVSTVTAAEVAVCINAQTQWTFNSLNQSPCEVASYLAGVCSGVIATIPLLVDGGIYVAGSPIAGSSTSVDPCKCNTVVYSLLTACNICQIERSYQLSYYNTWSYYSTNCTTSQTTLSGFPRNIPANTRVPHWSYLDVVTLDIFNETLALSNFGAPESIPLARPTGTSSPISTSSPFHTPTASQSGGTKLVNVGAIAGGVVGGLALIGLIIGGLLFRIRRRRKAHAVFVPSGDVTPEMKPAMFADDNTDPVSPLPQKPYDPSDPDTYPLAEPASVSYPASTPSPVSYPTSNPSVSYSGVPPQNSGMANTEHPAQDNHGFSSPAAGQVRGYTGVAEI